MDAAAYLPEEQIRMRRDVEVGLRVWGFKIFFIYLINYFGGAGSSLLDMGFL